MNRQLQRWTIGLAAALCVACVTPPRSPAEAWFFARASYTSAKEAAVECLRTDPGPCRRVDVAERIVGAMERGDRLIRDTEALYLLSMGSQDQTALVLATDQLVETAATLEKATP